MLTRIEGWSADHAIAATQRQKKDTERNRQPRRVEEVRVAGASQSAAHERKGRRRVQFPVHGRRRAQPAGRVVQRRVQRPLQIPTFIAIVEATPVVVINQSHQHITARARDATRR